jgi:uncharacterized membrane protein
LTSNSPAARYQAARPAPPSGAPIPPRERVRALRQHLRPRVADPDAPAPTTADQQTARAQRIAELAAAGLSPAEIRQRLRDPPQGP